MPPALPDKQTSERLPAKAIRRLLSVIEEQGHSVEQAIQVAGLDFNPLQTDSSEQQWVDAQAYSRLYRHIMLLMQDEAYGTALPERSPPGSFRILCRYILPARDLRQALTRYAEFTDLLDRIKDPTTPTRRVIRPQSEQQALLCFYPEGRSPASDNTRVSVMLMMYRLFSWFCDQPLPLQAVHLNSQRAKLRSTYQQLFSTPVLQQLEEGLLIDSAILRYPIQQNEQSLQSFLRRAPYPLISGEGLHEPPSLSQRIETLLSTEFNQSNATAQQLGARLGLSARSLHRHLQQEGISLQQLKDRSRRRRALALMRQEGLSVSSIALLLGFQDTSAFHRAFKKWTGTTPGRWRQTLNNNDDEKLL